MQVMQLNGSSGPRGSPLILGNDEHRDFAVANDGLCNRPHCQAPQAGPAMRTDHDQLGFAAFCLVQDHAPWDPFADNRLDWRAAPRFGDPLLGEGLPFLIGLQSQRRRGHECSRSAEIARHDRRGRGMDEHDGRTKDRSTRRLSHVTESD